ncbi:MAG: YdcF family protein [Lachnospiraceae bacterium]|nr:YdcF family protein [Lachnospiraceae bacterium]
MRHVLETGCLSLGILCLLYYLCIVLYAGITTSFAWIWLVGGGVFLFLAFGIHQAALHPHSVFRFVNGALGLVLLLAVGIVLGIGSRVFFTMRTDGFYTLASSDRQDSDSLAAPDSASRHLSRPVLADAEPELDYVIVLGAQVRGTSPSRALRRRLERAAAYAAENPDVILILSGGQGADEDISEAECMYGYLVDAGVSEERLIKEDQSTNTKENLEYSAQIIAEREGSLETGVGIVTNNFHIYRALLYARESGYPAACGLPASSDIWMMPHNALREICALLVWRVF